jgi:hypothetical protein
LSSDDSRSSEKCAFAFCRARRSPSASRWKTNQLSPWDRISAGMLPGCWVTMTAPRSYLRPSFTHETNGPSPCPAVDPSTDCASSRTAITGTLRGSFLVNSPWLCSKMRCKPVGVEDDRPHRHFPAAPLVRDRT